jgi:alpha-aminoadipic semialdehyde synthase
VELEDYLQHKEGLKFDRKDYFKNPQFYESIFAKKVAPYSRFLLNGIFWDAQYPRLLTTAETRALAAAKKLPLLTLSDVSCDINVFYHCFNFRCVNLTRFIKGSMEFMSHASTIDDPYYMYDPITNTEHSNVDGPGIQIMSIDNLPSEMPLEASDYFSESLFPFVAHMVGISHGAYSNYFDA